MTLANEILDFLINVSAEASISFQQSPEMMQKLASMLIYFLGKLCGPQRSKLTVNHPERYGFAPKELLGKIAKILAHFADSNEMSTKMAGYAVPFGSLHSYSIRDLDYSPVVMEAACDLLPKIGVLEANLIQRFVGYVKRTNEAKGGSTKPQDVSL